MSNRNGIIASAIAVSFVSFISVTSMPASAEPAAESECLAAPKAATPAGAHWYYRLEKGTKRKCWYLSDAGAKVKQVAETTSSPAAADQDVAPPPKKMQKSLANARAELRTDSPDEDKSLAESTWPPLTQPSAEAVRDDNQAAAMRPVPQPSAIQDSDIASRWPEPAAASAENQSNMSGAGPAQPAPALTPDRLVMAAATTPAPTATIAATTPPHSPAQPINSSSDDGTFSIRILLSVLVCALALAAIIGPMIFKYIWPQSRKDSRGSGPRRPIWDMEISQETVRQDNPPPTSRVHYADALPEPRVLDEAVDEIENLLARASRRPAA